MPPSRFYYYVYTLRSEQVVADFEVILHPPPLDGVCGQLIREGGEFKTDKFYESSEL